MSLNYRESKTRLIGNVVTSLFFHIFHILGEILDVLFVNLKVLESTRISPDFAFCFPTDELSMGVFPVVKNLLIFICGREVV